MSLKSRFLLLTTALTVLATGLAWVLFSAVAERVIEQWGLRVVDIQVRYDSARLLRPIEREIALAQQMADSQVLKRWAREPQNPLYKAQALREMESYRLNFQDRSFFVALQADGAYFHNNAANDYAQQPLRYHLRPDNPADAWFYQLVRQGRPFHLNVNPDETLKVTKLWIDVLMRDGDHTLGIVGTGVELDAFLREVVDLSQPGITSLFVDGNGAIQLYRDQKLIDFASVVKPEGQKSLFTQLLDRPEDRERMQAHLQRLRQPDQPGGTVLNDFVVMNGQRHLVGMAYLPTIGWYEVTLIDLDQLMPVQRFVPIAVALGLVLVASLGLFHLALRRWVVHPLAALERAMLRVRDGDLAPPELPRAGGEVGRLIGHFDSMARAIRDNTRDLEAKVRERTEALDRLASVDALTGLANRRGMTDALARCAERARRDGVPYGVIYLDIDWFKQINDQRGHAAGDAALVEVARLLRANLRPYDHAGRWGGDEFLVVLAPCDRDTLLKIGERIREDVAAQTRDSSQPVTLSMGGTLAQRHDDCDALLHRVDEALYAAKAAGRNAFRLAEEPT
ncbi:sensor domain-containing diguanylate cyclase [Aquabacterium sp. A08]|uniref:GGDEF domain-containing protein n=1 Tax=Aquabacterium sp. A08 TaxID=2718532 RepID=UPI00142399FA|nr:sensor domain-containing diguanylate cyclase [Aquabacterium sp. A08]NIC42813.1 diguanylate cyclase [Aquabacterium sp. A08]